MSHPNEQLINEVRLLYQSLIMIGEDIHTGTNISMGMRAVLEYLDRNGDETVPNMARARRVTRQRIQTLVNALTELDLVKGVDNPNSKRSPLITLTTKGRKKILAMRKKEGERMKVAVADKEIVSAAQTLKEFRLALESRCSS